MFLASFMSFRYYYFHLKREYSNTKKKGIFSQDHPYIVDTRFEQLGNSTWKLNTKLLPLKILFGLTLRNEYCLWQYYTGEPVIPGGVLISQIIQIMFLFKTLLLEDFN